MKKLIDYEVPRGIYPPRVCDNCNAITHVQGDNQQCLYCEKGSFIEARVIPLHVAETYDKVIQAVRESLIEAGLMDTAEMMDKILEAVREP